MIDVVCPGCATSVSLRDETERAPCPACGGDLTAAATTQAADADTESVALTADLRDAFGSGVYDALTPNEAVDAPGPSERTSPSETEGEEAPHRLGDFELRGELGRGGMGIVYRARQLSLNREVALKVLPWYARRNRLAVARFRRESQAAGRLHHTNIVPIYAQGVHEDRFFYAMELIEGESLHSALRCDSSVVNLTPRPVSPPEGFLEGPRSADTLTSELNAPPPDVSAVRRTRRDYRRIARLLAEVADGLEHAHRNGVIHRDIKPHNLLLGQDHRLHITDFGLAHLAGEPHLTLSGEVMGTPSYMSPEQVGGNAADVDHRTDVYSLGVSLYELLSLRQPFDGETRDQIIYRICHGSPPSLRRIDPRIPPDLETICLRAMEREPQRRFRSASALADDLFRFAEERPIRARRIGRIEKAAKWARRHKGASTAIMAIGVALLMGAVLLASLVSARRGQAARLIDDTYAQLVYRDFRGTERVISELDRAEDLGGNLRRIELLRVLASMRGSNAAEPVRRLTVLRNESPGDVEVLYLLAWAYWGNGERAESERCFQDAEALGGAETAAEWFFRGLASQRANPERAIESYRLARRVRAQAGGSFPQATLHLARAGNQLMYRRHRIGDFAEIEQAFEDLIDQGMYGARPYCLLSIAHRLAAEVYAGSSQGPLPTKAREHYDAAIEWANEGKQHAAEGDDEPWTVEAEALESTGRFEAAIAARTQAIEKAHSSPRYRREGHHYRWRLHYWTGQFDQALEDLERWLEVEREVTGAPDMETVLHSTVYPALVLAEAGRMDEAVDLARGIATDSDGPTEVCAQKVLWSATCLRLLGRPAEAEALLADLREVVRFDLNLDPPQTAIWVEALYDHARGRVPFQALLSLTVDVPVFEARRLEAEAYFHAAAITLATGDREGATRYNERAYQSFDTERGYTYHAKILRVQWQADPAWPRWIDEGDSDVLVPVAPE